MSVGELTEQEKVEVRKICANADALYDLMDKEKLGLDWKHDTERFMFFAFFQSEALARQSKAITCLTIALLIFAVANPAMLVVSVFA